MSTQILKSLFTDIEKGMVIKIIMDISKKDPSGIPVKNQYVANVGNMLFGNGTSPSPEVAIGFQMNINVVKERMSLWTESKKGILKGIIIELLTHDKMLEEEFILAKEFFDALGIDDPKFDILASLIISNPWG